MIRDAREHNAAALTSTYALTRIRRALPEFFASDGSFMADRLTGAVTDGGVEIEREGYELKFLGKSYAKLQTGTRTETVLVPDREHNAEPENVESENLYVVGDNLDALKHLIHSYAGRITCIYIDPPYNTGGDGFVYSDSFGFTTEQLVERLGLGDDEAERVLDMHGKSSHSAWLTFMYPRLALAKELLADDGVIFISIDENEQANLALLCDEIFGEQNLIGQITVLTNPKGRSQDMHVANSHDYLLAYSRRPLAKGAVSVPKSAEQIAADYPRIDPERGPFRELELRNTHREFGRHNRPNLYYPFFVSAAGEVALVRSAEHDIEVLPHWNDGFAGCWSWGMPKAEELLHVLTAREIDGRWKIFRKDFAYDDGQAARQQVKSIWTGPETHTEKGQAAFNALFEAKEKVFQSPKPVALVERVCRMSDREDAIVLDFFSGSATTAHAVMQLNAEDGGQRRFIMVQLPEPIEPTKPAYAAGYRTIDEIGRERIRRAAAAIRERTGAEFDGGCRLIRLERPAATAITELEAFDPTLDTAELFPEDMTERFAFHDAAGHEVILATLLNEDGFGMHAQARRVMLHEYELAVCGSSAYIIRPGLTSHDVEELVRQLENDELAIERLVVFGYSVEFTPMQELQRNLAVMKSGRAVDVITRL